MRISNSDSYTLIGCNPDSIEWITNQIAFLDNALRRYEDENDQRWVFHTKMKLAFYNQKLASSNRSKSDDVKRAQVQAERVNRILDYIRNNPELPARAIALHCNISESYAFKKMRIVREELRHEAC